MVVPLDDFDIILGSGSIFVMPHLSRLLIADVNNPSFLKRAYDVVQASKKKSNVNSVIQIEKGLKHDDVTYLAVMVKINNYVYQEVLNAFVVLLEKFRAIMPMELPMSLSPRRAIDHKIELEQGAVVPAKALYYMNPVELVELRRKLTIC